MFSNELLLGTSADKDGHYDTLCTIQDVCTIGNGTGKEGNGLTCVLVHV